MMTFSEARQRLAMSGMRLSRRNDTFRVTFAELSSRDAEPLAYETDDLEDAALTGARMRHAPRLDSAFWRTTPGG
ncbi:hypothetical protein [Bradyrhizobium sp. SZCCHNS3053]|uniref:hypothetical protein n=1 Tax=Bradyrhizobium sp. SZCCHNS3053 TaxID=3057322 RepID=UPI002916D3F4|nr:hypothetical protein [Bradyrhizobium sp. SZCCHNS3053]